MIKYLSPEEFKKQFSVSDILLGKGRTGNVYKSGNYAVKLYNVEDSEIEGILALLKELNYYTLLTHPNIIKPVAWTFDKIGYMVMPLGIPIEKAYEDKLVTMKQIIFDTMSALCYIDLTEFAHHDHKVDNMIFHDNRVKIIDMGSVGIYPSFDKELLNLYNSYLMLICSGYYLEINEVQDKFIKSLMISYSEQIVDTSECFYSPLIRGIVERSFEEIKMSRIFLRNIKYEGKVEPHLIILKEKYKLCREVFHIMMSLIERCDILPNERLTEYICMKIAVSFFASDSKHNLNISFEDITKEMDNEVTIDDCYYTVINIMRLTQNKILTY